MKRNAGKEQRLKEQREDRGDALGRHRREGFPRHRQGVSESVVRERRGISP